MCLRWDFTVPSEITKHRAIWLLVAPVATNDMISRSRAVNDGTAG